MVKETFEKWPCPRILEGQELVRIEEKQDGLETIEKIFADTWKTGSARPQLNRDSAVPYFDIC